MTRQEKNILTTLVLANVFLFCCLAPNLILYFDLGDSQNQIRALFPTAIPTARPTVTPRATAAPARPASNTNRRFESLVREEELRPPARSTAPPLDAKYRPRFEKIAKTIRWTD